MKKENDKEKSNKCSSAGARLKECREFRKMTQEALAEALNVSTNYISMLERGQRPIDWDKAVKFADVLHVSSDFIMCKSDLMIPNKELAEHFKTHCMRDELFVGYLMTAGYDIIFHAVKLYDGSDKLPEDNNFISTQARINELEGLDLSNPRCKVHQEGITSECIIYSVYINDMYMTFGQFGYYMNRIYDYISFFIPYAWASNGYRAPWVEMDKYIYSQLEQSRLAPHGLTPNEQLTKDEIHERFRYAMCDFMLDDVRAHNEKHTK